MPSDIPQAGSPPDQVSGPMSTKLSGMTFRYSYPSGISYTISFNETDVYFTNPKLVSSDEGKKYICLPYRAREIRPNVILAHWMTAGRAGHVALTYDLENAIVHAAALMPGKFELFEDAEIQQVWENGENALWTT